MNADETGSLLQFAERYQLKQQLWLDGPHAGWCAFDRLLTREVVLNVAYESRPDRDGFVRQARLRSRLRHPHLIPILDMGFTDDDLPFFTEPKIDTVDLHCLVQGWDSALHTSPPRRLAKVVSHLRAACHAADFLHGEGYCFLHLTPRLIAVHEPFDEVFVTEQIHDPNRQMGGRDYCIGKPAYMAPEQLTDSTPTPASDVYALGGILYWLLNGRPPNFLGERSSTVEVLKDLLERVTPPPGRDVREAFAASTQEQAISQLQDIAFDALEPDPARRTESASVLSQQLDGWLVEWSRKLQR